MATNNPSSGSSPRVLLFKDFSFSSRKRIANELFQYIRNGILSGKFPPGYVFPNETDLCKQLDIGRSTLREAYAPLETLRLITRTKRGTYVNSEEDIKNPMNFEKVAQFAPKSSVMQYRRILEPGIVRIAAEHATPEDIQDIMKIIDIPDPDSLGARGFAKVDYFFHRKLAEITGNDLFVLSMDVIRKNFLSYAEHISINSMNFSVFLKEHRRIISALEAHDPYRAEKELTAHLNTISRFE